MRLTIILMTIALAMPLAALADDIAPDCRAILAAPSALAPRISKVVEKDLKHHGFLSQKARGYSILIATMVASAALTTYVTGSLPPDFQFVSQFLGQLSTLGVYVFGAPIWEPLASAFRKMAFGVKKDGSGDDNPDMANQRFEHIWQNTQENYSLNAQMSRGLVNQFLMSVHQNFYEAYRAMNSDNADYAADQLAEAAFRMRVLFRDLPPDDPSVAAAIQTAFMNHVQTGPEFVRLMQTKIAGLDGAYGTEEAQLYYGRLNQAWFHTESPGTLPE